MPGAFDALRIVWFRNEDFHSEYSLGFSLLVPCLGAPVCFRSGLILAVVFYLRVVVLCSVVFA